mgnify:CR=1 FL=1
MKNKLIVRIAEGLGNQLFMYAHAYSLSKKINYDLYIDNTSGYFKKKNQLRSYELDKFNIDHNLPDKKYKFDTFFSKSQFYERLIRIDHPIYHHTLRKNVKYSNNVSFIETYELCTNNHGFKSKCNQVDNKNYEFAFIGDSFTEATPIEYEDSFVGLFEKKTGYKTANLGIVSYSPKIYLSKINFLLKEGFKFDHVVIFIDISDFYDDVNFYSIDDNLIVTEKYSKEKNLKRRKFLRRNFPLTNFYMFVIKKYKFKKENDNKNNNC